MTGGGAQSPDGDLLANIWYFAAPSKDIRRGAMRRKIFWDEAIVLGRTEEGVPFALADTCPHRAAPLSAGRILSEAGEAVVECPYHGWRFRTSTGACARIPALAEGGEDEWGRIAARRYHLHEAHGLIWIYRPGADGRDQRPPATPAPDLGSPPSPQPRIVTRTRAEGPYDEAVIGLVDPAHTPVVHRKWWWREGAGLSDKIKTFEPTALGFKMPAHKPSSNSRIYKALGGAPTTEIEFRLPGIRLETIRVGKRCVLGLTAITPAAAGTAEITHVIYWDLPLLTVMHPIAARMAQSFLAQDGAILRAQNLNLARESHRPLYVGDPDEPAKWYMRLKRAWRERPVDAAFVNPLAGGTLRWRT